MSVYVDTSAFYAYMSDTDDCHAAVLDVMRSMAQRRTRLVTTSYVVSETMGLLQRRLGFSSVRLFVECVLPVVAISWVGPEEHAAAWKVMTEKPKRALSVVDASGIALMRKEKLKRCIALDPEFEREGFEMLPGSAT